MPIQPFFFGFPREERQTQQRIYDARLIELREMNERALAAVKAEADRICANIRAAQDRHISEFRDGLSKDSVGWFDGLDRAGQMRVSSPLRLNIHDPNRSVQRDYNEERATGWSHP